MEGDDIKVFLKIKPTGTRIEDVKISEKSIEIQKKTFTFDRVFASSSQQEIYTHIANESIVGCMQGYNCIVFAYGQTGSGKTYTIQGTSLDQGLVPRTLGFLHNSGVCVKISFLEIYNEQLFDLFNLENAIALREDPFRGVYVENLTEITTTTYEESMSNYSRAISLRKTSATVMNNESSRSHSIFMVHIDEKGSLRKQSMIIFVDLAGSERLSTSDLVRKTETSNINRSLLCLGEVIKKLSKNKEHISYRDSKLTFLLRDSLAGNARLAVIGTVNLAQSYVNETMSTLKFMSRVKQIKSNPILNSDMHGDIEDLKNKIKSLDAENQRLKMQSYLSDGKGAVKKDKKGVDGVVYKMFLAQATERLARVKEMFGDLRECAKRAMTTGFDAKIVLLREISRKQDAILDSERERLQALSVDDLPENR